jgi:DNA-binding MarR family transcriptional regulator
MQQPFDEEPLKKAIDQFMETVPSVWNQIRAHLHTTAMDQFDVSVEQYHILRHIRKGLTTVSELADVKNISRPAISQTIELLVEKDLVTRRQAAGDRRFVHLELTPQGNELLDQIFQQNRDWMAKKMAGLSVEELNLIAESMTLLKSTFDASAEKSQPLSFSLIGK